MTRKISHMLQRSSEAHIDTLVMSADRAKFIAASMRLSCAHRPFLRKFIFRVEPFEESADTMVLI